MESRTAGRTGALLLSTVVIFMAAGSAEAQKLRIEDDNASVAKRLLLEVENNGAPRFVFINADSGVSYDFSMASNDAFTISQVGTPGTEFTILTDGRVRMGFGGSGVFNLAPNGDLTLAGVLTQNSDATLKEGIVELDGAMVLAKLEDVPISLWNYKTDEAKSRHAGPMAKDWHTVFGLGENERGVAPGDLAGVALAAAKELQQKSKATENRVVTLEEKLRERDQRIEALEAEMASLRELITGLRDQ